MNEKRVTYPWQALFAPESIAVIGASGVQGSWGYGILRNLINPGRFRIYPVNPRPGEILGFKAYPSVTSIPDTIDLAVIVVSAERVPDVFEECAKKGVRFAVVISGGFAETGEEGLRLENRMMETAQKWGLHFVGPNTMGHADTSSSCITLAWSSKIAPGSVGVISQSGNYCFRIIETGVNGGLGFSKIVVTGNERDLHLEDYLEYLGRDEATRVIVLYIEGLREGRRFFDLAKEIGTRKPIVAIKTGSTQGAARAITSHTGAMAGEERIYDAAFRQTGIIRVHDDDEICDISSALLHQPLIQGDRIGIITIGGGLGVTTAEACEKEGLRIARIAPSTVKRMDALLPSRWSHANPVDMVGISMVEMPIVFSCLWTMMEDEGVDAVLLIAPIARSTKRLARDFDGEQIPSLKEEEAGYLRRIREQVLSLGKPVILIRSTLELVMDQETAQLLRKMSIPAYPTPAKGAKVLRLLLQYADYLRAHRA